MELWAQDRALGKKEPSILTGQWFLQDDPVTHWWPVSSEQNLQVGVQWAEMGEKVTGKISFSILQDAILRLMLPSWNLRMRPISKDDKA